MGGKFEGYHGVIIIDIIKIRGTLVAIAVSLEILLMLICAEK